MNSTSETPTVLLTGATGMIGRLLVDELVDRDVRFAVMVRSSSDDSPFQGRAGIRVVRGDFDDPTSLEQALSGVDRAFLLTNSSERTEQQQLAFVRAAASAGVGHVVKLSQLHAASDANVRFLRYHAAVESAIREAGLGFTFVRPNLIMQAYLAFAPLIAAGGFAAPIGNAAVSVADARDIAAVCATALTQDGHEGRTYDVTGPEAISHQNLADALARAAGHDVRFESVSGEDFAGTLERFGMPTWQAAGLVEDYAHYERGEAAGVSSDVEDVTGHGAIGIDAFARDHSEQFRGAG